MAATVVSSVLVTATESRPLQASERRGRQGGAKNRRLGIKIL
jgi:hypothetical protein